MLRIIIAGGRDFNNIELAEESLLRNTETCLSDEVAIISGGAKGADSIGEALAVKYNTNLWKFPAQWDQYGKSAGYRRNMIMAENADLLIAFWDGKSKGTKHMIDIAKAEKIPVEVINY